jgi:hypothetical protein
MRLFKRSSLSLPLAFSVQPSNNFLDNDGRWSTFNLQVGSQLQNFQVVVSTSSFDTWLPIPPGCPSSPVTPSDCPSSRGVGPLDGTQSDGYDGTKSNTAGGQVSLEILNVGKLDTSSLFGPSYSNVTAQVWADDLYMSSSTGPSTVRNSSSQVPICGIIDTAYYLSSIGVGVGVHKTTVGRNLNSTIEAMAASGAIPSHSWGYTAGAYYGKCMPSSTV